MRAGALRHQIIIQSVIETPDASGSPVEAWSTFATVSAAYEPQNGKESVTEDQEQATLTTRFRIRYMSGVTAKMRISFDSRIFDIRSIVDVGGRQKQLHILCGENV